MDKRQRFGFLLLVIAAMLGCIWFWIMNTYYPMGGEVTVLEKGNTVFGYTVTVEQEEPGDAGNGKYRLRCTPEQYEQVEIGQTVDCDRMQSALTREGKVDRFQVQ